VAADEAPVAEDGGKEAICGKDSRFDNNSSEGGLKCQEVIEQGLWEWAQ